MDTTAILPPNHAPAARSASEPPATAAAAAARPAPEGFAVKSLDRQLDTELERRDQVALTAVQIQLDVDKSTDRVVATVLDRETGEVLNQFPAEAILANARGIRALLARELDMKV